MVERSLKPDLILTGRGEKKTYNRGEEEKERERKREETRSLQDITG